MKKFTLFVASFLYTLILQANVLEATLAKQVDFKLNDVIKLKDSIYSITIGTDPGTKCAIPGQNCGSGYIPPHITYKIDCGNIGPCPYSFLPNNLSSTSGSLIILNEETCLQNNPESCMPIFSQGITKDLECNKLKTLVARYYCIERFPNSKRPENKPLCDLLPDSIFALKWNCYYQFAVRYQDPSFCEKYSAKELSGKDRCWLKMASVMKDAKLCKKITKSKEYDYLEQCQALPY